MDFFIKYQVTRFPSRILFQQSYFLYYTHYFLSIQTSLNQCEILTFKKIWLKAQTGQESSSLALRANIFYSKHAYKCFRQGGETMSDIGIDSIERSMKLLFAMILAILGISKYPLQIRPILIIKYNVQVISWFEGILLGVFITLLLFYMYLIIIKRSQILFLISY